MEIRSSFFFFLFLNLFCLLFNDNVTGLDQICTYSDTLAGHQIGHHFQTMARLTDGIPDDDR